MEHQHFSNKLVDWYLLNKRDFPWRNTKNPYFIWLSEIILQQTKTTQGLPYYLKFIDNFVTIKELASAKEERILKLWQGLGYYSRARNLHFSAKYVVNELDGEFPNTFDGLLKLKGVGDYTASAIASICFNERCAVVDGNVYRVLSRYFGIKTPINSTKGIKEYKILAQSLLPTNDVGNYNQAIMDFGATICTPKKTKCDFCVINDSCYALQKKEVGELPVKTSKIKIKRRFFNYLVLLSTNNHISINKRINKGIWQHLYEFPLIESDYKLSLKEVKSHKLIKELGDLDIRKFNEEPIIHKLSHQHIYTNFWIIKHSKEVTNSIPINRLKEYPVPILIANFIEKFDF